MDKRLVDEYLCDSMEGLFSHKKTDADRNDLEFGALDTKIRQIPSGKFVTSFVAGVTRFSGVLRKTAGTSVLSKNLVYSSFIFDF